MSTASTSTAKARPPKRQRDDGHPAPTPSVTAIASSSSSSTTTAAVSAVADTTKPHCSFGPNCMNMTPQHRSDSYHSEPFVFIPPPGCDPSIFGTTGATATATAAPPPSFDFTQAFLAQVTQAQPDQGSKQARPPPPAFGMANRPTLHQADARNKTKSLAPSVQPFDEKTFLAQVINDEQKYVWELRKKELSTAIGSALDDSMIPDLQNIVVNDLVPPSSFAHTFVWKLKPINKSTRDDWTNNVIKNIEDKTNESVKEFSGMLDEYLKEEDIDGENSSSQVQAQLTTSPAQESPPSFVSKVGGLPYLKSNQWPVCGVCDKEMPFMFQLLLSDFPEHLGRAYQLPGIPLDKQLLQFFLCNPCGTEVESDDGANNTVSLARILDISDYDSSSYQIASFKQSSSDAAAGVKLFPERLVVGWSKKRDFPSADVLLYVYGLKDTLSKDQASIHKRFPSIDGEKLSGFPRWVQGERVSSTPYPHLSHHDLIDV